MAPIFTEIDSVADEASVFNLLAHAVCCREPRGYRQLGDSSALIEEHSVPEYAPPRDVLALQSLERDVEVCRCAGFGKRQLYRQRGRGVLGVPPLNITGRI